MAIINKLDNVAGINYDGNTINSNVVSTILALAPTITKIVDMTLASLNDILTYTMVVTNISLTDIKEVDFFDAIPEGSIYVDGSFRVDGVEATATLENNTLSYKIASIAPGGVVTIVFQTKVTG